MLGWSFMLNALLPQASWLVAPLIYMVSGRRYLGLFLAIKAVLYLPYLPQDYAWMSAYFSFAFSLATLGPTETLAKVDSIDPNLAIIRQTIESYITIIMIGLITVFGYLNYQMYRGARYWWRMLHYFRRLARRSMNPQSIKSI